LQRVLVRQDAEHFFAPQDADHPTEVLAADDLVPVAGSRVVDDGGSYIMRGVAGYGGDWNFLRQPRPEPLPITIVGGD
jgi:hypothetical protein